MTNSASRCRPGQYARQAYQVKSSDSWPRFRKFSAMSATRFPREGLRPNPARARGQATTRSSSQHRDDQKRAGQKSALACAIVPRMTVEERSRARQWRMIRVPGRPFPPASDNLQARRELFGGSKKSLSRCSHQGNMCLAARGEQDREPKPERPGAGAGRNASRCGHEKVERRHSGNNMKKTAGHRDRPFYFRK